MTRFMGLSTLALFALWLLLIPGTQAEMLPPREPQPPVVADVALQAYFFEQQRYDAAMRAHQRELEKRIEVLEKLLAEQLRPRSASAGGAGSSR